MELLQFLFFLLSMFTIVVHSKNHCPSSSCGSSSTFQIRYPFKLEGQPPQNCNYTDIKCNITQNQAVLNLPFSEDLSIRDIDYDSSTIELYDPNNCLPRKLMNSSFQDSIFEAKDYQNFTFYNCPRKAVGPNITAIQCLSNSTNVVVMEGLHGCSVISTSQVPVNASFDMYDFDGSDKNLVLKWSVPVCIKDCEGGGKLKVLTKVFAFILMIPTIAMLLIFLFLFIACCIQTVDNFMRERANATVVNRSTITQIWIPSDIFNTSTLPPPTVNPTGLDESKIKSCSDLVVLDLDENGSIIGENYSCSICLEIYGAKEKIRRINLCQHCFHANCVDQWLQKNSTCPICRVSLLDVKL